MRKKVCNCTKFKTPFTICALVLLIWKVGGLIKFFLGGQRICIHLLKLRKLETCFKHFCTFKKQLVRDFVWNFWNFVQLMKLVWSMLLHLQKKHWLKIKLSQNFQKFGQIMKLQTSLKNFAPSNKKKLVRDFVWNFVN